MCINVLEHTVQNFAAILSVFFFGRILYINAHSVNFFLSKSEMVDLEAFVELTRNDPYITLFCLLVELKMIQNEIEIMT